MTPNFLLEHYAGIIALCFVVLVFGSGMLTEVDFNSFSWHTLFLLGGGNVLGKAVSDSRLLNYISEAVIEQLPLQYPWAAMLCIMLFTCVVSTFVSHTVAAIILMPLIVSIGVELGGAKLLVIGAAFAGADCRVRFA
jgi:phosphate transporter